MMNDTMEKHETSNQQKVFEDKQKKAYEKKVLIDTCNNYHPSSSNQIGHQFHNY